MDKKAHPESGFTLLELLVAMTIFAFIALGAHAMLTAVLNAHATAQAHAEELLDLQKTMRLMEQDFTQMEAGSQSMDDGPYAIRFARRGWGDPLGLPRSDRLTVAYGMSGDTLVRYYWPPGNDGGAPVAQPLLRDVTALRIRLTTPQLIDITFSQRAFGDLRREIEVVSP